MITHSGKLTLIDIKLESNSPMRQSNLSKFVTETQTLIGGSFAGERTGPHWFKTKSGRFNPLKTQHSAIIKDSDLIANQSIAELDEESLHNNINIKGSQLKQSDSKVGPSIQR